MAYYPMRGTVRDVVGRIVVGAQVIVREHNSATLATIYASESGGTPVVGSVVTTDTFGQFMAWVSDNDYPLTTMFDLTITNGVDTISYPIFPFNSFAGALGEGGTVLNMDYGSNYPTTGSWSLGWIRWNNAPTAGGVGGWICITAGSPGTWREFALINVSTPST